MCDKIKESDSSFTVVKMVQNLKIEIAIRWMHELALGSRRMLVTKQEEFLKMPVRSKRLREMFLDSSNLKLT